MQFGEQMLGRSMHDLAKHRGLTGTRGILGFSLVAKRWIVALPLKG